jgi:hypothetical protein
MEDAMNKRIDWTAKAEQAEGMTVEELNGALHDILATLPNADAMDRAHGTDDGGYYRDEASVLRKELKARVDRGEAFYLPGEEGEAGDFWPVVKR